MERCPDCQTLLEPWEVTCHKCGKLVSLSAVPVVYAASAEEAGLAEAFTDWFNRGKVAMDREDWEGATACLKEALKRCRGLKDARDQELKVRACLAQVLERDEKTAEAAEQVRVLTERAKDDSEKQRLSRKLEELQQKAAELAVTTTSGDEFKPVNGPAVRYVPLYCAGCKRLLTEAEVYGLRQGLVSEARCLCGFAGKPLAKHDAVHARAVKEALAQQGRKAKLIKAASEAIPEGKQRMTAAILAVLLGEFGAHKLYLGERGACIFSLIWCLAFVGLAAIAHGTSLDIAAWVLVFVPWFIAIFEAVGYLSMSPVTFNLNYNVDRVLAKIPPEHEIVPRQQDLFSMEITEDPEDFVDDLTLGPAARRQGASD